MCISWCKILHTPMLFGFHGGVTLPWNCDFVLYCVQSTMILCQTHLLFVRQLILNYGFWCKKPKVQMILFDFLRGSPSHENHFLHCILSNLCQNLFPGRVPTHSPTGGYPHIAHEIQKLSIPNTNLSESNNMFLIMKIT